MPADQSSLASVRLEELRRGAEEYLKKTCGSHVDQHELQHELALWLFLYNEGSDLLVHSDLIHPADPGLRDDLIVKSSQILGGTGTIGFILRTRRHEVVVSTFDDPRGTVAVQDALIGNYSWCGVPIKAKKSEAEREESSRLIGIVSFFPVSTAQDMVFWPSGDIAFAIGDCLAKFVQDHVEEFLIVCELSRVRKSNELLTSSSIYDQSLSFGVATSIMLQRLLELGSPYDKMPYVAYIEMTRSDPPAAICSDPSFLRCDTASLRVRILEQLQWDAVSLESRFATPDLGDNAVTLPLTDERGEAGEGFDLRVHMRARSRWARGIITNVYEPWREVFGSMHREYVNAAQGRQKVLLESAAALFGLLARAILSDRSHQDRPPFLEELKKQIRALLRFVAIEDQQFAIKDLLGKLDHAMSREHELDDARLEIIALSLWHEVNTWAILGYSGFHESDLEKLSSSGNWKVLQRAALEENIIDKYRMVHWPDVKKLMRTQENGGFLMLAWDQHEVRFSRKPFSFPLDVQICGSGYAQSIFDTCRDYPLSVSVAGKLEPGKLLRSAATAHLSLKGSYRVIAVDKKEEGLRGVVIGPLKEEEAESEALKTLEQFAQKELHVVLLNEYANRVTDASRRAAVAAIMARNASHNIGSHVLARHAVRNLDDNSLPGCELKDVQLLERYLQGRMDFVAQISTDWPQWTEAARLAGEIIWGFLSQRILLEEIIASEGIGALEWEEDGRGIGTGRDGEIRISCISVPMELWHPSDGKDRSVEDRIAESHPLLVVKYDELRRSWNSHASLEQDPLVAVPGGVTGWHAVYIILENIIRNAAKHGQWEHGVHDRRKSPLDIVLEVRQEEEAMMDNDDEGSRLSRSARLVRIYDNISALGTSTETNTLDIVNGILDKSLVDAGGRLRQEHWGLAEMKIAAAFLQQRPVEPLSSHSGNSPFIIRAICSPARTLGYELLVLKPRRVGVACNLPGGDNDL